MSEQDERDEQGQEHEERSLYPTGAPGEGGDVDEDRLKWLASDEDGREAVEPPLSPAEEEPEAGPAPEPANRNSERVRAVVLFVLIVALGGGIWHTYAMLTKANQALKVTTMSLGSIAGYAPKQITAINDSIEAHRYDQVSADLQKLASLAAKPATTAPPGPDNGDKLPPEVGKFFNLHPDIMRQWLALAKVGRAMKDKGYDLTEFRALRDQAFAAAGKGDEAKVRKLGQQFEDRIRVVAPEMIPMLQQQGEAGQGPPGPVPSDLEPLLQSCKPVLEKAANEHRDIRQAMRMIEDAKAAAGKGDYNRARELLVAAKRAAERAPKMAGGPPGRGRRMMVRRPGGPMGMPGGVQGPGPLQALQLLMRMVQAETPELSKAYETLENAQGAVRENNGDQITELIQSARETLKQIAERRHQVWLLLNSNLGRGPGRPGARGAGRGPGPQPTPPPGAQKPLPDRLAGLMEDVRKMKDSDFEQNKGQIVEAIFAMFLPPEPAPGPVKPIPAAEVERVKVKLRLASGPYFQKKASGEDMDGIDDLFRQARTALYAGDTVKANQLVDEALTKLGLMRDTSPTAPTVAPPQ